jgi:hypothetical protein
VNSFIFAVLGFMTFSAFYSPQFVLWLLPLVCFSDSCAMLASVIALSWLTYLYFPWLTAPRGSMRLIVAVTLVRLFMMVLTVAHCLGLRFPIQSAEKAGALCK